MKLTLRAFQGIAPKITPILLPEGAAVTAENCRFSGGSLAPWNATSVLDDTSLSDPSWPPYQTIYRYQPDPEDDPVWFAWTAEVQVTRGPVPNDWWQRIYYTGDGKPKVLNSLIATTGTPAYPLCFDIGVPSPAEALVLTVTGAATSSDPTTAIDRVAVMTFVNEYGEEGPPSPVSNTVTVYPGQTVHVANMDQDYVAGNDEYVPIENKRLYFTNTGTSATEYQYVDTIAEGTDTADVDYDFTDFGEVLGTEGWEPPPDNLMGIVALPNGCLAGFVANEEYAATANTVYLSVPYQPHAWPYSFSVAERIVALAPIGNSLLVLTDGLPTIATGDDPSAMSIERLATGHACTSRRGVVDVHGTIIYPCDQGLGAISMQGSVLVTEGLFTEREWEAYAPGTIHAYHFNGKYIGFFDDSYSYTHDTAHPTGYPSAHDDDASRGGFTFNLKTQQFSDFAEDSVEYTAGTAYGDGASLALYDRVANAIRSWEGGSALTYTWRSKPYLTSGIVEWGVVRVFAAAYPVTVKLYENSTLKSTTSVTSAEPQRLPGNASGWRWQVEVTGTAEVYSVELAPSVEGLVEG